MVCVVYGTTGELIKLAPVLTQLRERGHEHFTVTTAQQVEQIPPLLEQFGLPTPDFWVGDGAKGRDLRTLADIPGWLARVGRQVSRNRRALRARIRSGSARPLVLVHGDTMTTVLGALIGRMLRVGVAHIESGLRSNDWRHPFPEELNRRTASVVARIHYAPGPRAAANLSKGTVVDTGSNTIRDSLEMKPAIEIDRLQPPGRPFGLVSIHRFELLRDKVLLTETIEALRAHAEKTPLLFVDHPVTAAALERFELEDRFRPGALERIPRLGFFPYVELLRQSDFLVTDSGGSQEECYYLDHPCLVHRKRTERHEGLGENVVLSGYDLGLLHEFLSGPERYRRRTELPAESPTGVIVEDLRARGYV
jgi:UDP-N-acetylglucosamine 2-epimerase (non-hydrolysing)